MRLDIPPCRFLFSGGPEDGLACDNSSRIPDIERTTFANASEASETAFFWLATHGGTPGRAIWMLPRADLARLNEAAKQDGHEVAMRLQLKPAIYIVIKRSVADDGTVLVEMSYLPQDVQHDVNGE